MKTLCEIDRTKKLIVAGPFVPVEDDFVETQTVVRLDWAQANGYRFASEVSNVPASVELWKFRAACQQHGILDAINAWIAAQPEPPRIALTAFMEYGTDVPRDSETVEQIAKALGKTDAEIDALFIDANSIEIA